MRRVQVDARLLVASLLALLAGGLVHSLTRPQPTVAVLVAAAPLAAGSRVADLDLTTRQVAAVAGFVPAAERDAFADHTLVAPLAAGDPLLTSLLTDRPGSRPDVVALTLDPAHAVQGDLTAGDRVDVYVSADGGTRLLAGDVAVVSVAVDDRLGGGDVALLLAVDQDTALTLVAAMRSSDLDLVRRPR